MQDAAVATGKPIYVRAAIYGFLLLALGIIVVGVSEVISDGANGLVFPIIVLVVLSIPTTILLKVDRTWALIVGFVFAVFGWLFLGPSIPSHVALPGSFFDFAAGILILAGLVLALAGVIAAFLMTRSGDRRSEATGTERMAFRGVLAALAILSLVSLVVTITGKSTVSAADREGATFVHMKKTKFDVSEIAAKSSGTTKIVVKNDDPFYHTFTVDDLKIDITVTPGSEKLVQINAPKAGTYVFRCKVSGHDDMKGEIKVQ